MKNSSYVSDLNDDLMDEVLPESFSELPVLPSSHTKELDRIIVKGAREHNLKDIDVEIPKKKLVVF
ncbi:MAG: hypothetical protein GY860_21390, partial [Desulfobacteraceae bacterium]|nr:hypothetical protein [Desulfobacteraceae bacterium]